MNGPVLAIIDDFYPDPERIRELAFSQLRFKYIDGAYYPGQTSEFPTGLLYPRWAMEKINSDLKNKVQPVMEIQNGHFRVAKEGDPVRAHIHVDICDVSAFIYLTPDLPKDAGTSFWYHKRLNTDRFLPRHHPAQLETLRRNSLTMDEFVEKISLEHLKLDEWEETDRVEYRYNRCLIIDPTYFHSQTRVYGSDLQTGRMTQNFFLECQNPGLRYGWPRRGKEI